MSECVRDLIRDDEKCKAQEKLETLPHETHPKRRADRDDPPGLSPHLRRGIEQLVGARVPKKGLMPHVLKALRDLTSQWIWYSENAGNEIADRFLQAADDTL